MQNLSSVKSKMPVYGADLRFRRPFLGRRCKFLLALLCFLQGMGYCLENIVATDSVDNGRPILSEGHYSVRGYEGNSGLPKLAVQQILQDKEGFIWVGTEDGLFRYDGYRFEAFRLEQGLLSTAIDALYEDTKGVLWVGTHAGLSRWNGKSFDPISDSQGLAGLAITALSDGPGGLWALSSEGPYVRDEKGEFHAVPDWPGGEATAVYFDSAREKIWLAQWNGKARIWCYQRRRGLGIDRVWQPVVLPLILSGRINGIVKDAKERLWVAPTIVNTSLDLANRTIGNGEKKPSDIVDSNIPNSHIGQLWSMDPDASNFVKSPSTLISNDAKNVLLQGRYGHIWLSTTQGLFHLVGDQWLPYAHLNGVTIPWFHALLEDREGALWLGNEGLYQVRGRGLFHTFTEQEGLPDRLVWCVFRDKSQRLWLGTHKGLALLTGHGFKLIPGTEMSSVRSIVQVSNGILYFAGFPGDEILSYDPESNTLQHHNLGNAVHSKRITRLLIEHDSTLLVGTDGGGLLRVDLHNDKTIYEIVHLPKGSDHELIGDLTQDKKGRIWVAGQSGLAMFDGSDWHRFTTQDGLRRNFLTQVLSVHDDELLVAYFDPLGVVRVGLQNGKLKIIDHHDVRQDHTSDKASLIGIDVNGNLWIGGSSGLDGLIANARHHFGVDDGLLSEEINNKSFYAEADGDVWIGTSEGLIRFDAAVFRTLPKTKPPEVRILDLSVGFRHVAATMKDLKVENNKNVFEARFTGLDYLVDGTIQYKERLQGLESEFNITSSREVRYPGLAMGEYNFTIAARSNSNSDWGPETTFSFEVLPAWYQTYWFHIVEIIMTVLIVFGIVRWRTSYLHMRHEALEKLVLQRTAELVEKQQELLVKNRALAEAKIAADAGVKAKADFLSNMSHEIRTPMNAIIGFSHLGLRLAQTAESKNYFHQIETAGKNLLGIVNDILDFSKIEAGKLELESVHFSLSKVLHDVANLFSFRITEKDVELVVGAEPDVPDSLVGDSLRLSQVLINLTGNALKFTSRGKIVVKVELSKPHFDVKEGYVQLRFSIEDTGIGMTEEQQARLFKAFSQADASTSRQYGGTGLGLSISRKIVEQMGGNIQLKSAINVGSAFSFSVELPYVVPITDKAIRFQRTAKPLDVLVVDDCIEASHYLASQLKELGCSVSVAQSGWKALELLPYKSFDLILMDWSMPEMDGVETVRRIRADTQFADIPEIIMVTAYSRESVMREAAEVGIQLCLIKPVDSSSLIHTMQECFGLEGQQGSAISDKADKSHTKMSLNGMKVLLVEDNVVNQQVGSKILGLEGVDVDIAGSGADALYMVDRKAYDVVLMDIQMPEMDGYEATKRIRANPGHHALPIVAMTAHVLAGYREVCLESGMDDYVSKPINPDQLFSVLSRWRKNDVGVTPLSKGWVISIPRIDYVDIPGIDTVRVLTRLSNDYDALVQLLVAFKNDYGTRPEQLRAAIDQRNFILARQIAHTIKGVSGNLSATKLYESVSAIEKALTKLDFGDLQTLLEEYEVALEQILQSIRLLEKVPILESLEADGHISHFSDEVRGDICIQNLFPAIQDLVEQLNVNSPDAELPLTELIRQLSGHSAGVELSHIKERLDVFDFEGAEAVLDKWLRNLIGDGIAGVASVKDGSFRGYKS